MLFLLVIIIVVVAVIVLKKRAKQNAEHSSAVQAAFSSVLEEEEAHDDSGDSDDDGAAQSEDSDGVEAASGGGIDCSDDGINPTLLKAAEMGNKDAMADVALMYFLGSDGVKQSWEKANMWFESADFSDAFDNDGEPNYAGISDWARNQENCEEAVFHVLEMTVAEGKEKGYSEYVNAAFELAQCYENGDGVKEDLEKALYWYEQSSDVFGKDDVKRLKRILDKRG